MEKPTHERRQKLVFRFAFISTALASAVILVLIGLQIYVRWYLNKDFTFLGGFELETLTASVFALMFGMVFAYRQDKGN